MVCHPISSSFFLSFSLFQFFISPCFLCFGSLAKVLDLCRRLLHRPLPRSLEPLLQFPVHPCRQHLRALRVPCVRSGTVWCSAGEQRPWDSAAAGRYRGCPCFRQSRSFNFPLRCFSATHTS